MRTSARTSSAAPDSLELRRQVARVGRRARLVLIAGAFVAALAADVWYGVLNFVTTTYMKFNIYFPAFFLVAFAVFAAAVLRRTRALPLSRFLDDRHALKARLSAAFSYGQRASVPADLREAQARETLRAVDFARLRSAFRFRPWGALACLTVGVGLTAGLVYRFPEFFENPHSRVFRRGRIVFMTVKNLGAGRARDAAGTRGGADSSRGGPDDHPAVVVVPEQPVQQPGTSPGLQPAPEPGKQPPAGKPEDSRTRSPRPDGVSPDAARTAGEAESRSGKPREARGSRLGPNEGGSLERAASLEETKGVSLPTERPEHGLGAVAADLRGPGAGPDLPPLPFVRLLGGGKPAEVLFDPETLNIVLESYPPKYRGHLESYLKALQALKEERHGS